MGTIWKNKLSVKTTDKMTGNVFANQIPGSSDDPNADHFVAAWTDELNVTVYTSQSRMTDNGRAALEGLIDSGQADSWLDDTVLVVSTDGIDSYTIYDKDSKRGRVVNEPCSDHIDWILNAWRLKPSEQPE
jgi:hypothetical protein